MTWKTTIQYPNYTISDIGEGVKNKKQKISKRLHDGYYKYNLTNKDKKRTTIAEHRLVALAYLPNPKNKLHVNHIDHNKINNVVGNLEWATASENMLHEYANKKQVYQYDVNMELLHVYQSKSHAARKTGFVRQTIGKACKLGILYKDCYWEFIPEDKERCYEIINIEAEEDEFWIEHPIYTGYKISNIGRVQTPYVVFSTIVNKGNYALVKIYNGDQRVHRLVAETFIENPDNLPEINHIDGNKLNNRIESLEWIDRQGQMRHAVDTGLLNTKKSVQQIDEKGDVIETFDSIVQAAKKNKINKSSISHTAKGKAITVGGLHFKYTDDDNYKIKENMNITPINIYDLNDGFIKRCESVKEAANYTGENVSQYFNFRYEKDKFQYKYEYADKTKIKSKPKKKVYQFDMNGTLLADFESAEEASEKTPCSYSEILSVCKTYDNKKSKYQRLSTNGFKWSYKDKIITKTPKNRFQIGKYDLQGTLLKTYNTNLEAAEDLDIDSTTISKIFSGSRKQRPGYILKKIW